LGKRISRERRGEERRREERREETFKVILCENNKDLRISL